MIMIVHYSLAYSITINKIEKLRTYEWVPRAHVYTHTIIMWTILFINEDNIKNIFFVLFKTYWKSQECIKDPIEIQKTVISNI